MSKLWYENHFHDLCSADSNGSKAHGSATCSTGSACGKGTMLEREQDETEKDDLIIDLLNDIELNELFEEENTLEDEE